MRSGEWLHESGGKKQKAKAAHFHACWLFWLAWSLSTAASFSLFCAFFCLLAPDRNGLERSSELWSPLVISQAWRCTCSHLWRVRQQPPAAAHRSTSLPWLRRAGARSGDGAGKPTSVHVGRPHMVEPTAWFCVTIPPKNTQPQRPNLTV